MQRSSNAASGCRVISNPFYHARLGKTHRLTAARLYDRFTQPSTCFWHSSRRKLCHRDFSSQDAIKSLPCPKSLESLPEPLLDNNTPIHNMVQDLEMLRLKLNQSQSATVIHDSSEPTNQTGTSEWSNDRDPIHQDVVDLSNFPLQEFRQMCDRLKEVPGPFLSTKPQPSLNGIPRLQLNQSGLNLPFKIPSDLTAEETLARICREIVNHNFQLKSNDFVTLAKILYNHGLKSAAFRVVKGFFDSGFHGDFRSVLRLVQLAVNELDVDLFKLVYPALSSSNQADCRNVPIENLVERLGHSSVDSDWLQKLVSQRSSTTQNISRLLETLQGNDLAQGVKAWARLLRLLRRKPNTSLLQEALIHASNLLEKALDGKIDTPSRDLLQVSTKEFKSFLLSVTFLAAQNGLFLARPESAPSYAPDQTDKESVSVAFRLRTIMAVRAVFATHRLLAEELPKRYRVSHLFSKSADKETSMNEIRQCLESKFESMTVSTADLRTALSSATLPTELKFYLRLAEQGCFQFMKPTLGYSLQYLTMLSRAYTLRLSSSFVRHMVLAVWLPDTHIYNLFIDRNNYSMMLSILEDKHIKSPRKPQSVDENSLCSRQLEMLETEGISDAQEIGLAKNTFIDPDSQMAVQVEVAAARFIRDITVMDTVKRAVEICLNTVKKINNTRLLDLSSENREMIFKADLEPLLKRKSLGPLLVDYQQLAKLSWSKLLCMQAFVIRKYVVQSDGSRLETLEDTIGKTVGPRFTVGNTEALNTELFNALQSSHRSKKVSTICKVLLSSNTAPNSNSLAIILQEFTRLGYIAGAKRVIKFFQESKLPVTRRWALAIIDLSRQAPIPSLLYNMSRRVFKSPRLGRSAVVTSRVSEGLLEFNRPDQVPRHLHWFLQTSEKKLSFNNLIVQLKLAWMKRDNSGDEGFLLAWQAWNELVHQERQLKAVISETAIFYAARLALHFTPLESIRQRAKDPLRNRPVPSRLLEGELMVPISVYKAEFLLSVIAHAARSGIPLDGFSMLNSQQQHPLSYEMLTHRSQQWRYYNALRLRLITRIRAIAWQATKAGHIEMHQPVRYFNWLFSPNRWKKITIQRSLHAKHIGFAKELHREVMRLISGGITSGKGKWSSGDDDGDDIDFYLSLVDRGCFRYFHRNIRRYRSALKQISVGISQTLSDPYIEAIFNEISLQEPTKGNILNHYHKALKRDQDVFLVSKFNTNIIDDYEGGGFVDGSSNGGDDDDVDTPHALPHECNNYFNQSG